MRRPLRTLHLFWWAVLGPVLAFFAWYAIQASQVPAPDTVAPAGVFSGEGD